MTQSWEILLQRQAPLLPPPTPEELAYSNAPQILGITGSFFALAAVVVLLRCYVRVIMLKIFGADDYVMLAAMALNAATFACFELRTHYGLGRHAVIVYANPSNVVKLQKVMYVESLTMMIGISAVKISVALTLLRLSAQKVYNRILWSAIGLLTLITLACGGTLVWQCLPVAAAWDYTLRPPPFGTGDARCYSTNVFRNLGLMNSSFNIVTDVAFACFPIPVIWQLQLNLRTKTSLIAILSLGWFACCAAIVKTVYQWRVFEEDMDIGLIHDRFFIWAYIEFSIGIIAASLPALKPLFRGILDTARAITSDTRNKGNSYRVKGSRSSMGYSKTTGQWSQEIPMESMTKTNSTTQSSEGPYRVAVSARPTGRADKEAWEAHRKDSDEDTHPLQPHHTLGTNGIVRTMEIDVT